MKLNIKMKLERTGAWREHKERAVMMMMTRMMTWKTCLSVHHSRLVSLVLLSSFIYFTAIQNKSIFNMKHERKLPQMNVELEV